MFNNKYHYSFKTFLHFWLAKIPCMIHPNQLLWTKFGRTLPYVKNDVNRAAKLPDYWTVNQDRPGDKNELFWWWLQKAKHFAHFTRKKHLQANYWLKTYQEQQEDNSTDDICYLQGCQPWMYSKLILRIDRGGMVDNVITHSTWRHLNLKYSPIVTNLWWAKTCEKDVVAL